MNVIGEVILSDSDCEHTESQTFSLSRMREAFVIESQQGIHIEGTREKTPPASRRKIMRTAPQQSSQPTSESTPLRREEENQEHCSCGTGYGGRHRWTARDTAVTARMVRYLDRSDGLDMEELEDCLLGLEEFDVDNRHIALNAKEKGIGGFSTPSVSRD